MMCHAKLTTESKDATSVAKSLHTDNMEADYLSVTTRAQGGQIVSEISSNTVSTLLATVDDLIRCQITSESLI